MENYKQQLRRAQNELQNQSRDSFRTNVLKAKIRFLTHEIDRKKLEPVEVVEVATQPPKPSFTVSFSD